MPEPFLRLGNICGVALLVENANKAPTKAAALHANLTAARQYLADIRRAIGPYTAGA